MAPDLKGAGARWTRAVAVADRRCGAAQSEHHHAAVLPHRWAPSRGPRFRGKPMLTAEQIEDVVAFLMTLQGYRRMIPKSGNRFSDKIMRKEESITATKSHTA